MSDYRITLSDKDNSFENDLRLSKLTEKLTGIDKPPYRIIAPKGPGILHWGEASLSWLDQIHDVEFVGNGVTIQPHPRREWQGAAFMFSNFYGRGIDRPVKPGYRFKTAQKGSNKLYLWTPAEISNFYKGQRILLMGRELQGYGYPPNPAFYEWHVVKLVGGGSHPIGSVFEIFLQ